MLLIFLYNICVYFSAFLFIVSQCFTAMACQYGKEKKLRNKGQQKVQPLFPVLNLGHSVVLLVR